MVNPLSLLLRCFFSFSFFFFLFSVCLVFVSLNAWFCLFVCFLRALLLVKDRLPNDRQTCADVLLVWSSSVGYPAVSSFLARSFSASLKIVTELRNEAEHERSCLQRTTRARATQYPDDGGDDGTRLKSAISIGSWPLVGERGRQRWPGGNKQENNVKEQDF